MTDKGSMIKFDPVRWLRAQAGETALRARRKLGIQVESDSSAAAACVNSLRQQQEQDGSFANSPMKTACVLNLLDDLDIPDAHDTIQAGADFLSFGTRNSVECTAAVITALEALSAPGG